MSDKTFFDFILLTFHENAGVKTIKTEIPADAFRGNRLREVVLPP